MACPKSLAVSAALERISVNTASTDEDISAVSGVGVRALSGDCSCEGIHCLPPAPRGDDALGERGTPL